MEDKTLRITSPEPEDSDSSKLNIDNAETDGFDSDDGMFTDSEVEIDPDGELFLSEEPDPEELEEEEEGEEGEEEEANGGDSVGFESESDSEDSGDSEETDAAEMSGADTDDSAEGTRDQSGVTNAGFDAETTGGQTAGKDSLPAHPVPDQEPVKAPELIPTGGSKSSGKSRTASYREKILRHKRRRYRRTIEIVIIVTALLVAAVILWMRRGYTRAELIRIAQISAVDGAGYENFGGKVVQYSNAGAVCIDQRGNTLWNVTYEMQQPITSISGNVLAIANRDGYYVYVMNTQGLMGTIRTTLPIHNIAAAENGEVAVIMNDNKTTWIRLYTAEGREIAYIVQTMEENGYPIAAAVSPDGETLCLSSVQMANSAVKTNISFYNFGKEGRKVSDHLVQHSDFIDEVIPFLHYTDNSTCVCVSDKQLFCFWSTLFRPSGSTYVSLPDNMQGVFCSDSFIGVLSSNTKGKSQYTLELFNKRGESVGKVNFSMQYMDIAISGDKVYIYNEQQCQIYTVSGHRLFDGTFGRSIRAMIPGAGLSDLLVVTEGEVDSVRLH